MTGFTPADVVDRLAVQSLGLSVKYPCTTSASEGKIGVDAQVTAVAVPHAHSDPSTATRNIVDKEKIELKVELRAGCARKSGDRRMGTLPASYGDLPSCLLGFRSTLLPFRVCSGHTVSG